MSIDYQLEGWELLVAELELIGEPAGDDNLGALRHATSETARRDLDLSTLSTQPTVAAMRALFRAAGTDPTRYRPSSEALLRRILKGDDIPRIHPFVDLNNCLSAALAVPCCVMAEGSFEGPFVLRSGEEGESYDSLRGPFNLAGRPLLVDRQGPCDAPITGSKRVMVTAETSCCTLIAYLPQAALSIDAASEQLDALLAHDQVADSVRRSPSD